MIAEIEHWVFVVAKVVAVVLVVACGYKLYGERIKRWFKGGGGSTPPTVC